MIVIDLPGAARAGRGGQRALPVRYGMGAPAVELQPRQDRTQIVRGVVVAQHRAVQVRRDREVAGVRAQMDPGGERGVEDVVGVLAAVTIAVLGPGRPGGRDELHGAHRTVVAGVPVQGAVIGVGDVGEARAVEHGPEDRREGRAVRVDPAATRVPRLHLAEGGQELPGQMTAGLGVPQPGFRLLVRGEDGDRDALLRPHRVDHAHGRR